MPSDEKDDKQADTGYNKIDGEVVEKIDLNNLVKLNDTEHEHNFVKDADETEDYYSMKCTHPRCHRGYLVSKHM
jgi:hypothetical protein